MVMIEPGSQYSMLNMFEYNLSIEDWERTKNSPNYHFLSEYTYFCLKTVPGIECSNQQDTSH